MNLHCFILVLVAGALAFSAKLEKYHPKQDITCPEGLYRCKVRDENLLLMEKPHQGPVVVSGLDAKAALCCKGNEKCKTCVLVTIQLQILTQEEDSGRESGEGEDDDEDEGKQISAEIRVRFYSGPNLPYVKIVSFTVMSADNRNATNTLLRIVEYKDMHLGSRVNVTVDSFNRSVLFPSPGEVCPSTDIEECKTPRVSVKEILGGMVELKSEDGPLQMCVKRGEKEEVCRPSPQSFPLHTVTPCMCFEAWKGGASSRSSICPFTKRKDLRVNVLSNMSLSVRHTKTNDGRHVLGWNLSAPCRLDAEVWPCRMGAGSGGGCAEVPDVRVFLSEDSKWQENSTTLWTTGSFVNVSPDNPLLHCVMFKVDGKVFGPMCQHETHRGRWSAVVLVVLLVFTLLCLGVCFLRNRLEGFLSNWEKTHHSGGSRGEVLLLHTCGSDVLGAGLVCGVGVQLSELGFGVSLDLWSQDELSCLGPGPWLRSKLAMVQKRGGRALLVLSDSALDAAQAWWDDWNRGQNQERTSLHFSDVFGCALGCLFSAHLKGEAAEHFALVQFDSTVPVDKNVPELFRGLQLYHLPLESRQLLAGLCPERPKGFGLQLKRLLWLRRASRRLTQRLKKLGEGLRPHSESVLTQAETLEDEEEQLPLHV